MDKNAEEGEWIDKWHYADRLGWFFLAALILVDVI